MADWNPQGGAYTLSLVASTGNILASIQANTNRVQQCGPMQAGIIAPPPVSTSNTRAYFLDSGTIKWLREDGSTGTAFGPISIGSSSVIGFAVSPDDTLIAINTIDYSQIPLSQKLTVTQMGASSQGPIIYSARDTGPQSTAAVWPLGWHSGNLVLAYHPGTCTQGGGPGQSDPTSYHVVDPQSAGRVATIGSDSYAQGQTCGLVGYPGQAGIPCANYMSGNTKVFGWSGSGIGQFSGNFPGALSPDGQSYVGTITNGDSTSMSVMHAQGASTTLPGASSGWALWIDNDHFVVQSWNGPNQPLQVFSKSGALIATSAATGQPIARIPPGF